MEINLSLSSASMLPFLNNFNMVLYKESFSTNFFIRLPSIGYVPDDRILVTKSSCIELLPTPSLTGALNLKTQSGLS